MAIKNSLTLENGITVNEAYIKIDSVYFTSNELVASVSWYATAQARDEGKPKLQSQSFILPYSTSISIAECYVALKALPDFVDAIDC